MDTSIKIPIEDIIELNVIKNELLRQDLRFSQKDLLDTAVRFSLIHKNDFIRELLQRKNKVKKDNTAEMTQRFLSLPKADFGKDWQKELDTISGEFKLSRTRKQGIY